MGKLIDCILLLALFSACSYGGLSETAFNPVTGESQTILYSKYFDKAEYLVGEEIGVQIVIDAEKIKVPGVYELQESLGLLGPDDLYATGIVTIYLYNLTQSERTIEIHEVRHSGNVLKDFEHTVSMDPGSRNRLNLGAVEIFSYARELKFEFHYKFNGQEVEKNIVAVRLSQEDLNRRYGQGGKPNFPWLKSDR